MSFPKKNLSNGTTNPKYVDLLTEDKPISGQKFGCFSFISPEDIIKKKEHFFFEQFVKQWNFAKSMQYFLKYSHFISYKYDLDIEKMNQDLEDFIKNEKQELQSYSCNDEFKNFLDQHESSLQSQFEKENTFTTSIRGFKCRGVYSTQEEAELRCKLIREIDPNFDVYVGPVGMWIPFHPDAYKTGRIEYMEEQLNELMHEKDRNEKYAKQEFDKRVLETKQKAIQDNIAKAKETGNVLSQTIDDDGNLINIQNSSNSILSSNQPASISDIRQELFEGDNIVTDKNSSHLYDETKQNM